MKQVFTILFLLLFAISFGQSSRQFTDSIRNIEFDELAKMTDLSCKKFKRYLAENVKYENSARKTESQGIAIVSFTIDSVGLPNNFNIISEIGIYEGKKYIYPPIDKSKLKLNHNWSGEELIRLIKATKWNKGDGIKRYEMSISFKCGSGGIGYDIQLKYAYKKANRYYRRDRYNKAIKYLELCIKLNPYDVETLKKRTICYHKLKRYEDACKDNKRLKTLGKNSIESIKCN